MLIKKLKHLAENQGFKKYFFNTSWLFLHQGVRLVVGFFVGLWIARYLGPEQFGIYNYAIAYSTIFLTFAKFGTEESLVKDFAEKKYSDQSILTTSFWLRTLFGLISYLLIVIFLFALEEEKRIFHYVLISSLTFFFQSFEVIDSYNRATVQAKKSSTAKIAQLIISAIIKVLLILNNASLVFFVAVFAFDTISYAFFIYFSHKRNSPGFLTKKFDKAFAKNLIKKSWPLMIVSVCTVYLTRIDLILIGHFLTKEDVGFYSASIKLLELTTLFPIITMLSLFTAIINAKQSSNELYLMRLQKLNRFLIWGSIFISLLCFLFSDLIIRTLYGYDFIKSVEIFEIICFNLIFFSTSALSIRWYILENLEKTLMIKMILASLISPILILVFIQWYGIKGAAMASLIINLLFNYLFELFFPKLRKLFFINTSFLYSSKR